MFGKREREREREKRSILFQGDILLQSRIDDGVGEYNRSFLVSVGPSESAKSLRSSRLSPSSSWFSAESSGVQQASSPNSTVAVGNQCHFIVLARRSVR